MGELLENRKNPQTTDTWDPSVTMSGLVEKLKPHKPLHEGAKVPAGALLKEENPEQATVDLSKIGGKYIIIGVPGAFTPPCSSHVPGFVEQASQFAEKGIKGIYVVGVNDQFTMAAWKEKLGADKAENVHFLADDTNSFTKQAGMDSTPRACLAVSGPRDTRLLSRTAP